MDDNFSPRVKDVIAYSKEEALRLGHDFIGTEHLMLGLLRDGSGKAINILNALDVDLTHLRRKVEILSPANPNVAVAPNEKRNLHLTRQAERALKTTFLEAKLFQSSSINTAHLLLCILRNENDPTTKLLNKLKVDYDIVKEQFKYMITNDDDYIDTPHSESFSDDSSGSQESSKENPFGSSNSGTTYFLAFLAGSSCFTDFFAFLACCLAKLKLAVTLKILQWQFHKNILYRNLSESNFTENSLN